MLTEPSNVAETGFDLKASERGVAPPANRTSGLGDSRASVMLSPRQMPTAESLPGWLTAGQSTLPDRLVTTSTSLSSSTMTMRPSLNSIEPNGSDGNLFRSGLAGLAATMV